MKKLIIALAFLSCFSPLVSHAVAQVEISDGSIKSLYHMEDQIDSSGNGFTLTNVGTTEQIGQLRNGMSASSSPATNERASSTAMDISADYTVGLWIKPLQDLSAGDGSFIKKFDGANREGFFWGNVCAGGNWEWRHNGVCVMLFPTSTPAINVWHWYVITRNGSAGTFFIDNVPVKNFTDANATNANADVFFNGDAANAYFKDIMEDEVFFETSYMPTSTRTALWNAGVGAEVCVTVGCANNIIVTQTFTVRNVMRQVVTNQSVIR